MFAWKSQPLASIGGQTKTVIKKKKRSNVKAVSQAPTKQVSRRYRDQSCRRTTFTRHSSPLRVHAQREREKKKLVFTEVGFLRDKRCCAAAETSGSPSQTNLVMNCVEGITRVKKKEEENRLPYFPDIVEGG